jgi:hypothetical protein
MRGVRVCVCVDVVLEGVSDGVDGEGYWGERRVVVF